VKRFIIDIGEDGEVKIETTGFAGKACIEESQILKDLLGHQIARQLTPAYYTKAGQAKVTKKHLPLCG